MAKETTKQLAAKVKQQMQERNRKAQENIKAYTEEINRRRAEIAKQDEADIARRKSIGQMTKNEQNRWDKMSKSEQRVIENRLANERNKKPFLLDEINRQKKEAYQQGTMTPEQKQEYERQLTLSQSSRDFVDLMRSLNPNLQFDENGRILNQEPGFFEGKPGYHINIPTMTPAQITHANQALKQVDEYLPGLLKGLSSPYKSGETDQLQRMFGHMSNPILQGLLNPNSGFGSQVPFASQLGGSGFDTFGTQLLQQAIPQGLQYASQGFSGLSDILSGLRDRFTNNKQ